MYFMKAPFNKIDKGKLKFDSNIDEKMTFKYKKKKMKERICHVSKMKNILKEICDAD